MQALSVHVGFIYFFAVTGNNESKAQTWGFLKSVIMNKSFIKHFIDFVIMLSCNVFLGLNFDVLL